MNTMSRFQQAEQQDIEPPEGIEAEFERTLKLQELEEEEANAMVAIDSAKEEMADLDIGPDERDKLQAYVVGLESRIEELGGLKPPAGWQPCSPELLQSGVCCRTAPRWSIGSIGPHWHPPACNRITQPS